MTRATWAAAVLATGAAMSPVRGDMVALQASADNTLFQDPNGVQSNGAGPHFYVGASGAGLRRGLIQFDVAGAIPAGSTVSSATLTLWMSRTVSLASDLSMHRVTESWGEGLSNAGAPGGNGVQAEPGDATWLFRSYPDVEWTTEGGDFNPTASATLSVEDIGSYSWPSTPGVVSDVQQMLDSPGTNFGWVMLGAEAGERTAKRFESRENEVVENRPVLTIEFTPPPVCAADANGDGMTNSADLSVLLSQFGQSVPPGTGADFNDDGMVNSADLSVMLGDFGCA